MSQLGAVGAGFGVGLGGQVEGQAAPLLQQALDLAAHALVHRSDDLHHVLHAFGSCPAEGVVKHHLVWTHRRQTFRHRHIDIHTDRRADRPTDRHRRADRQSGRQTDRQTDSQADRQTVRQTDNKADRQTVRQTDRQSGRQTDSRADRRTHRQRGRQTGTQWKQKA